MERLDGAREAELVELDCPVVLAGDYNIIPTDADVYKPERWLDDALFQPEPRAQYRRLLKQGWTDAIRHLHPDETIFTFWDYWRQRLRAQCRHPHRPSAAQPAGGEAAEGGRRRHLASAPGKRPATTRRRGSSSR